MSIKNMIKKLLPVTMSREDRHYEELKKENAELKKLIKELRKEIVKDVKSIKKDAYETRRMTRENTLRLRRVELLLETDSYGVTTEKRDKQIVVSLTSYKKRINTVPLVLDRIFNQTVKPDKVVLYLSKDNFPEQEKEIPERLLKMTEQGLEIRWLEGDIRSYKKLIPALRDFPDDIVITIDDDLYYELDFVERLYNSYMKHPNAISAYRTHRMKFDDDGKLLPYVEWDMEYSEVVDTPTHILFQTNGAGSLFPPHIFKDEIFNENKFMELCPHADDVWIKFMSVLSDIPIVLVKPFTYLYYVDNTQEESLWSSNRTENDVQIKNLLEEYDKYEIGSKSLLERIREDDVAEPKE